jgi:IS5 family transposase
METSWGAEWRSIQNVMLRDRPRGSNPSAIDERTTRHPGYAISQVKRKLVEEIFGWMKTIGGFRRTRFKRIARTGMAGYLVGAAYNLLRMARLMDLEAAA